MQNLLSGINKIKSFQKSANFDKYKNISNHFQNSFVHHNNNSNLQEMHNHRYDQFSLGLDFIPEIMKPKIANFNELPLSFSK